MGWIAACLLSLPAQAGGEAEPVQLAADLAPGRVEDWYRGDSFQDLQSLGDRSVFLRRDEAGYQALWVTDGTAGGTHALGVLCQLCHGGTLLGSNGRVAFYTSAGDFRGSSWTVIWRTDGTPACTFPLTRRHIPGYPSKAARFTSGLLFFGIRQKDSTFDLWSSDGSAVGTVPVGSLPLGSSLLQLQPGGDHAFLLVGEPGEKSALWIASRTGLERLREISGAAGIHVEGGRAFFAARGDGLEIWTSDGTAAGTRALTSFASEDPGINLSSLTFLGGRLYFEADDNVHGAELWSVGFDEGSQRRLTDTPGDDTWFSQIHKAGDRILFVVNQPDRRTELWSSLGDLESSAPLPATPDGRLVPTLLVSAGPERVVVLGSIREGGDRIGLWVTDGTAQGTRFLKEAGLNPYGVATPIGRRALIQVDERDLWITDGSPAGTFFATIGGHEAIHYSPPAPPEVGVANGNLVFPGKVSEEGNTEILWSSDGTPSGTRPFMDALSARSSWPQRLTPFRDGLLVQTYGGQTTRMWFVPPAGRGEPVVLFTQSAAGCPMASVPVVLGDLAVFLRYNDSCFDPRISLWRTDGTVQGTEALFSVDGSRPRAVVRWGDGAAFWVSSGPNRTLRSELWLTDGTRNGTRKSFELPPGIDMFGLTAAGGKLLFFDRVRRGPPYCCGGPGALVQPWSSDGTRAGTRPLTRAVRLLEDDDAFQLDPAPFVEAGRRIYFVLGGVDGPAVIWKTDGTPGGTEPAIHGVSPVRLSAVGGRLYFAGRRVGSSLVVPWSSDGTDAGTVLLTRASIDSSPWAPARFVGLHGKVFFAASSAEHGEELWSTDGTAEGTERLLEIAPGLLDANPRELTAWSDRLYFVARDGLHGLELWSSDGTAEGTGMVQDLYPGALWSAPAELTPTESGLHFSARDPEHGRELWVLSPEF